MRHCMNSEFLSYEIRMIMVGVRQSRSQLESAFDNLHAPDVLFKSLRRRFKNIELVEGVESRMDDYESGFLSLGLPEIPRVHTRSYFKDNDVKEFVSQWVDSEETFNQNRVALYLMAESLNQIRDSVINERQCGKLRLRSLSRLRSEETRRLTNALSENSSASHEYRLASLAIDRYASALGIGRRPSRLGSHFV